MRSSTKFRNDVLSKSQMVKAALDSMTAAQSSEIWTKKRRTAGRRNSSGSGGHNSRAMRSTMGRLTIAEPKPSRTGCDCVSACLHPLASRSIPRGGQGRSLSEIER